MSTPDNHGKKAPQFAAFKPLTTVQNANDCCCDGACSSTPTLSENVSGTRYSWKVSGMDCAACARKVENAVRQLAGVNQVQVLFATEKLVVDADNDIVHKLNLRCKKRAIPCAMSRPPTSHKHRA